MLSTCMLCCCSLVKATPPLAPLDLSQLLPHWQQSSKHALNRPEHAPASQGMQEELPPTVLWSQLSPAVSWHTFHVLQSFRQTDTMHFFWQYISYLFHEILAESSLFFAQYPEISSCPHPVAANWLTLASQTSLCCHHITSESFTTLCQIKT